MEEKLLWIDGTGYSEKAKFNHYITHAINVGYVGVLIQEHQYGWCNRYPLWVKRIINIQEVVHKDYTGLYDNSNSIILSSNSDVLEDECFSTYEKAAYIDIANWNDLIHAVNMSEMYSYIVVNFQTQTNIPLELLLTHAQRNRALIFKRVKIDAEGWVAAMVMETGSQGILIESEKMEDIANLNAKIKDLKSDNVQLEELEIIRIEHIGMGDRICIDTIAMLKKDEGMLLGATSEGGILVSSETHHLPYMELRPFRVNAGALHMYLWNTHDRTNYLSELTAGCPVMIVNSKGESRISAVGRIKMERRPILLIIAKAKSGIEVKAALQDDWHVRVIGSDGKPLNCTELKMGDIVLGITSKSGRHAGYKIDETVIEK